jgi:hypothetical protein
MGRRSHFWSLRFFAVACVLAGCSPRKVSLQPKLDCPEEINLGSRSIGEEAIASFSVTNFGSEPLILDRFTSSCSCAGIEVSQGTNREPAGRLSVAPGQSLKLYARITVRGQPGAEARTHITFDTNDPNHPTWKLSIVVPQMLGVAVNPSQVVFATATVGGG